MIALILISLFSSFFIVSPVSEPPPYTPIEKELRFLWKANIGQASFRSNITVSKRLLICGSNGNSFRDGTYIDPSSGVYFINAQSGIIQKSIGNGKWGDFDVNGTLLFNKKIFFGNDNEEFMCVDMAGNLIWKNLTSGDIEAEPVIIDIHGKKVIVYATELGEVKAVDPDTGKSIWSYFTDEFSGWREGDSRPIFKVKAFLSSTESFFTKPVLIDVDKDGVEDLIYSSIRNGIVCINGRNGNLLWSYADPESSFGYNLDSKKIDGRHEIWVSSSSYDTESQTTKCDIVRISENGKIIGKIPLQQTGAYSSALNSLPFANGSHLYASSDSLFLLDKNGLRASIYIGDTFQSKSYWDNQISSVNRVSLDQVFGAQIFKFREYDSCIVLLSQCDKANYSTGFITIVSLQTMKVVSRHSIPATSEMPPQIGDFDQNGTTDLLINCSDGKLYCYQRN